MSTRPLRCWDGHLRLALMEQANELLDMLPKRKVFMAERNQCTVCVMPVHQTERSVVSEAAQAALTEPGLDALPKATMRWPDSLQAVLLALRAACEANEQSLQRILCTPPVRSGQKDKQTAELKKLLWEYDALRLVCNTNSGKTEQFTAVRLLLRLMHEPGDDPTAEQGANMPELLSLMKTMRARSERLAKKTLETLAYDIYSHGMSGREALESERMVKTDGNPVAKDKTVQEIIRHLDQVQPKADAPNPPKRKASSDAAKEVSKQQKAQAGDITGELLVVVRDANGAGANCERGNELGDETTGTQEQNGNQPAVHKSVAQVNGIQANQPGDHSDAAANGNSTDTNRNREADEAAADGYNGGTNNDHHSNGQDAANGFDTSNELVRTEAEVPAANGAHRAYGIETTDDHDMRHNTHDSVPTDDEDAANAANVQQNTSRE
jgi:hypothetical protein